MALSLLAPLGAASPLVTGGVTSGECCLTQQVFAPILPSPPTGIAFGVGTAYFCYMLQTSFAITPKYVRFFVSTGGVGAQTAELGLFSTPAGPNGAAQSLTKLVATGTIALTYALEPGHPITVDPLIDSPVGTIVMVYGEFRINYGSGLIKCMPGDNSLVLRLKKALS